MVGGEPGGSTPELRKQVEDAFGAVVRETMGNGDMMGLMWGEREAKKGMHFLGGENPGDLGALKSRIEALLREKLIFSSEVTLVKPGTLPKYEYKAKLVETTY